MDDLETEMWNVDDEDIYAEPPDPDTGDEFVDPWTGEYTFPLA